MHYKMSYLLEAQRKKQLSIDKAIALTELPKQELLGQLNAFEYNVNQYELTIQAVSPLQWTETFLNIQADAFELDKKERQCMIFLMIYSEEENRSVYHFQDFLRVSRGTILADIKELRGKLTAESIEIAYNRYQGYVLTGHKNRMVQEAKNCVSVLLQTKAGKFALHYFTAKMNLSLYASIKDQIEETLNQTNVELVLSRLDEMIYFSIFSQKQFYEQTFDSFEGQKLIQELSLFTTSKNLLKRITGEEVPETNVALYTVCLLSVLQGDIHEPDFDFLLQLAAEIIHEMERYAAIQFNNFREFLFDVYNHLVPAFFRIKYGLILSNTMSDLIMKEYQTIFEFTRKALSPLVKATGQPIPDDELAYFTILFGGAIKAEDSHKIITDHVRALIVCPNGVSSSLILETELKQLFPSMEFIGVNTTESIKDIPEMDYEVIFSTVPVNTTDKNVYIVKPIMNQLTKNQLINTVQKDWLIPGFSLPNAEEIIEAMKPYVDLKSGITEEQLYRVLNRKINHQFENTNEKPRLSDLLVKENILFREKVYQYEDAIRIASHPLLENGSINEKYIEAMIENIEKRGPYVHLANSVALPHASAEDGSFKVGFSMLVLEEPTALSNDPDYLVDHFIILSVVDNNQHLDALSDLNALMRNKPLLNEFLNSRKPKDIINILKRI